MAAHKLTRTERHNRGIWLAVPAFVLLILPLFATIVAGVAGNHAAFVWLSDTFIRNGWFIIPATIVAVPLTLWSLKLIIVDDIREDARLRRGDEILLKFAPNHYARQPLPRWVRWGTNAVIALSALVVLFVIYEFAFMG